MGGGSETGVVMEFKWTCRYELVYDPDGFFVGFRDLEYTLSPGPEA